MQSGIAAALLRAAAHLSSTVRRSNSSLVFGTDCTGLVFAAALVLANTFSRNVFPFKKIGKKAFSQNNEENHWGTRLSLAAYSCTALDALRTQRTFSVPALRSTRWSEPAKKTASSCVLLLSIFVFSATRICCGGAVSTSATDLRNPFMLSAEIWNFPPSFPVSNSLRKQ